MDQSGRRRLVGGLAAGALVAALAGGYALIGQGTAATAQTVDQPAGELIQEGGPWTLIDELVMGEQICGLAQVYEDGTAVFFAVPASLWEQKRFSFRAQNAHWPIEDGQQVGDMTISAPEYQFGGPAIGGEGAFQLYPPFSALGPFLASAAEGGFSITPDETGEGAWFAADTLRAGMPALGECFKRRFIDSGD